MQRTNHSAISALRQISQYAAWVLVASLFIVACGGESQDSGNDASLETPDRIDTRTTPEEDTPTPPPASPSAVETRAEHEHTTPVANTATETSTATLSATASPTGTSAHASHDVPAATGTTEPDSTGVTEVQILDFSFDPPLLEVDAGTTVTFINQGVDHTATGLDDPGTFDTGILHTGESFSITFDTTGTFDYWCLLHPNMLGTIVVK